MAGGDGNIGGGISFYTLNRAGAGGVGGYNAFWIDPGSFVSEVDGKYRTSIIYDPPNGRQPPMTEKGRRLRAQNFASFAYENDGTASWLAKPGPGPFDGPETLARAERCLLGFSAGPPSLPGLYNNFKRIVQTEDHVMILLEMVHDARIIRLNSEHAPDVNRKWLGDSIGWWEGDTLVVETKNFKERTGLYGGDDADDGNRQQREHFVQRLPKNGKPACFPRLPVHVALAHELIDLVTDARARYPEDVREFLERWGKPPPVDEAAQLAKRAPLRSGDFPDGWSSSRLAAHGRASLK